MNIATENRSKELVVALEAAERASEIARDYFGKQIETEHKVVESKSQGLVTKADLDAEKLIIDIVKSSFPDHSFLAEESASEPTTDGQLWVIDPIDGTNNFAHGIPHFSVSIAYCEDGETKCGVVANPLSHEFCWAEQGGGAWLNNQQVQVGTESTLQEVIAGTGFYYDRDEMVDATLSVMKELFYRDIRGIRRFGSAALDLCYVGLGRFGVYFEYRLSPWDFAAGKLFVEEAGGRTTNCAGEKITIKPTSMLATNGRLHETVLELTRPKNNPAFYSDPQ